MKSRFGEMRGDGYELERETEESARQAPTFKVIVVTLAFLLFEVDRV